MTSSEDDLLAVAARSGRAAVVVDFDGTISEIVNRPVDARPVDGAVRALNALADEVAHVAVLSSRPVSFLRRVLERLSPSVALIGHSGLETAEGETDVVHESVQRWLPVVRQALDEARQATTDHIDVEDKRLSFTLHYRLAPEHRARAEQLAEQLAERHGLATKAGKMSIEVRPPVTIDKGTALRDLVPGGVEWLLYAGDDIVDVPGFDGARSIDAGRCFCVAVGSPEAPSELIAAADLVVPGPPALVELLARLADRRSAARGAGG